MLGLRCFLWGLQNRKILNKGCISMRLFYFNFLLIFHKKIIFPKHNQLLKNKIGIYFINKFIAISSDGLHLFCIFIKLFELTALKYLTQHLKTTLPKLLYLNYVTYFFIPMNLLKKITANFFLLFALFILLNNNLKGQTNLVTGKVINYFTNESIAFASVYWKKAGSGTISDSSGHFTFRKSNFKNDTIVVSYIGYEDIYHPYNDKKDTGEILLSLNKLKLSNTVEVKTKFNKGLRWWKAIVVHKNENNPYQYNNYYYELYNKIEIDINNIKQSAFDKSKLLKPFAFVLGNIDTISDAKPFLPIFLTESISDYYYSNSPYKVREEIKAIQTNGIKNKTVMQFMGGVNQKINVYENYINVFGKEFISPLSDIGDKYYNYKGADTQTINRQKYFHLRFTPKQAGTNTFSGDCWIHNTTWAIQKITLNISATANINFVNQLSIIQEFYQLQNGKWVVAKDKFIADLSPLKKDKLSFIGRRTASYKNVQINQPFITNVLSKSKTKEEVIINPNAKNLADSFWNNSRHEPLSLNENKVYKMIDTLKQIPLFKKYSNTLQFIFDGHIKLGAIEIGPWFKWFSGNQLEKIRMRFDVGTTEKFSKYLRLYGYLAYGLNDKRFKQKVAASYKFKQHPTYKVAASYFNDLDNGRIKYNEDDEATTDNLFSQLIRRQGIRQKFIGEEQYKASISKVINKSFTTELVFANTKYKPYEPLPSERFFAKYGRTNVINSQFSLKFRYAPGEKEIETKRRTLHLKGLAPIFEFKYEQALPNIFASEYNYKKISASVSQTFRLPRWGEISYLGYAGKYFGDSIPFMLLEVHPGNEIYYYNKQSFNLMNRFEYFSDKYVGFNVEYNFEKKLINLIPFLRKSKVRQFINIKTIWGNLNNADRIFNRMEFTNYRLKSLRGKNYTELGIGLDNMFKYFRLDFVWRFAPSFNAPITSTIPNNPQKFGIFGSFHLQL